MNTYCPFCLKLMQNENFCPFCKHYPNDYTPSSHHMRPGTILKERYIIGRSLGEGGFGITYLGLDTLLNRHVAIKEYFPSVFVYREATITPAITCYAGEKTKQFEKGRGQFLDEARVMARLDNISEIVRVLDFFPENNTAYIIMEFLTGQTMSHLLDQQERIPAKYLFEMMEPVLRAINIMHGEGIMHRDISPDNIMQLDSGQMKLLDFGCARDLDNEHTMTVMLKHGYAPLEQYTGYDQGPWTDVYALCATIYHCITGRIPPRALERAGKNDPLIPPRKLGATLTQRQERAIIKGLAVEPSDRWQSVSGLYAELYGRVIKEFPWTVKVKQPETIDEDNRFPQKHDKEKAAAVTVLEELLPASTLSQSKETSNNVNNSSELKIIAPPERNEPPAMTKPNQPERKTDDTNPLPVKDRKISTPEPYVKEEKPKKSSKPYFFIIIGAVIIVAGVILLLSLPNQENAKPTSTAITTSTPGFATVNPTATLTPRPSATPTPKSTATPTPKSTATPTPKSTATPAPRPSATPTPVPTATPAPTVVWTPTPVPTPYQRPDPTPYTG